MSGASHQRDYCNKFDAGSSDPKALITHARIDRLDEPSFVWDPYEVAWEQRLAELQAFKDDKGHCNVPRGWAENKQLGTWVSKQRHYRKKFNANPSDTTATITQARIDRLDELGFVWNPKEVARS